MKYINIEKDENGRVKAKAMFGEKEYRAEFSDMIMATIWAEELAEKEGGTGDGK